MSSLDSIDSTEVIATIARLKSRIKERFPDAGLANVCTHLLEVAENMRQRAEWIARPVGWLRILTWAICLLIVGGTVGAFFVFGFSEKDLELGALPEQGRLADFLTVLEAGINDVVLIGAAIFFLFSMETRYKRSRALKALHELRSIAHIIDMHQLTKDPQRISSPSASYAPGKMSPEFKMTSFELRRYLDYCSEMLALTGKIAAVYVQAFDDGVAMASASELETLTTGLSSKIWQKIHVLEARVHNGSEVEEAMSSPATTVEQKPSLKTERPADEPDRLA